ncbi:hypothetical protein [Planktothrix paucivesiculata]|uniref:Cell division protein FtsL n=1 Tax=Planktothrix paucivesiculata PCC 9631 TaxID=671071 RepID=A0A7Z9BK77_9CYAN|nr:hypothetical protein [Planktothrix paucivesiculata]VXD15730.1 conserved hypothetical protein [Planktothrix paucivesiculata PCC 9631]
MTVAFKSTPSPQRRISSPVDLPSVQSKVVPFDQARKKRVKASLTNAVPLVNPPFPLPTSTVVKALPKPQPQPLWLSSIIAVQKVSSVITSLIIGSTLTVYGLTVYGESSWTQEYPRLEKLRATEQQLRTAQELLKNEIAIAADSPTTGLVVPQPGDMIYVEPAKPRPQPSPEPTPVIKLDPAPHPTLNRPLGY